MHRTWVKGCEETADMRRCAFVEQLPYELVTGQWDSCMRKRWVNALALNAHRLVRIPSPGVLQKGETTLPLLRHSNCFLVEFTYLVKGYPAQILFGGKVSSQLSGLSCEYLVSPALAAVNVWR